MRFIDNRNVLRLLNFCFAVLLFCGCVTFVGCQTKDQKLTSDLKRCQEFLDRENVEEAGSCYQQLIKANSSEAQQISKAGEDAVFKKCLEFKDKKDFKNSIICLEGVVAFKSNSANVYFLLADSYYQYDKTKGYATAGDFEIIERAEMAIKEGLKIKPEDAAAHGLFAELLEKRGDLRKALSEYQQATKLNSKALVYWVKSGLIKEKLNDLSGALESYQKAVNIDPNDTDALYFLEVFYERVGKLDEAIETLEKRIKLESPSDENLQKLESLKEQREVKQSTEKPKTKSKAAGKAN